jgi:hypothetical protein
MAGKGFQFPQGLADGGLMRCHEPLVATQEGLNRYRFWRVEGGVVACPTAGRHSFGEFFPGLGMMV